MEHRVLLIASEDIPEEEANALLARLAEGIVRRNLTTPALFALEMYKPLNFVGSQVMIALNPFVSAFFKADDYRKVALLLERDANLERLLQRIEELDNRVRAERRRSQREARLSAPQDGSYARFPIRAFFDRFRRRKDV